MNKRSHVEASKGFFETKKQDLQSLKNIKGYIRVNVWLGEKDCPDVGHATIQVFRVTEEKNNIEEAYLGYWPLDNKELQESSYNAGLTGTLAYWKNLVFGVAGRFISKEDEARGSADYPSIWEADHDRFVKRLGVLPTYSFKFVSLDVDKAFAEVERLKGLAESNPKAFRYSPRATALCGTDNCISMVERVLRAAGFEDKLLKSRLDYISPLSAAVGGLVAYGQIDFLILGLRAANALTPNVILSLIPSFFSSSLSAYQKSSTLKTIANIYIGWALCRFVAGAASAWSNSAIACLNPQAPTSTTGKLVARSVSALFGGASYLCPMHQPLRYSSVHALKTPENFVVMLDKARDQELAQFPMLEEYNALFRDLTHAIPADKKLSRYILDFFSYHQLLEYFNPRVIQGAIKIRKEAQACGSLSEEDDSDTDQEYYKQLLLKLGERARKLAADLASASDDKKSRIQTHVDNVNSAIAQIKTQNPGL